MFHDGRSEGPHHASLENLKRAAEGGCKICKTLILRREIIGSDTVIEAIAQPLLHYILPYDRNPAFSSNARWMSAPSGRHLTIFYVLVSEESESIPEWYSEAVKYAICDRKSHPWRVRRECFALRDIPSNTGLKAVLRIAKSWMEDCEHNHDCEKQNGTEDPAWYPKRLIDLTDPDSPRLLETASERPADRYATLSHCWGPKPQFLTLNKDKLDSFHRAIPLKSLPQSFRDAILACHHLGIPYLWIDSLCILQDSEADWLLHAREMRSVYANCRLNLSIDAAPCPEMGGFKERNTDNVQECDVFFMDPIGKPLPDCPRLRRDTADATKLRRYTIYSPGFDFFLGRTNGEIRCQVVGGFFRRD